MAWRLFIISMISLVASEAIFELYYSASSKFFLTDGLVICYSVSKKFSQIWCQEFGDGSFCYSGIKSEKLQFQN